MRLPDGRGHENTHVMSETTSNIREYSVSELSTALKRTVEDQFGFVRLRGEISGYRGPHSSGHVYFSLKDDSARIEAVIWKGVFGRLKFRPEEGLEVIASGKLTTFPSSSKYQIVIDQMEPAGVGALMAMLDERRKRLAAEGLFDAARKQLLPPFPKVIGIVTSPTGAVIRDILHRLSDRFPLEVIVWPVRVQGESSAAEIAAAIAGFNALGRDGTIPRPDILIVARGGGSLEDLWSFNEEIVVRAAAASDIPLISAVGHETDTTLIDFAADIRAPTPTAAAELAVRVRAEVMNGLTETGLRLARAIARQLENSQTRLAACARALPRPDMLLAVPRQRLDSAAARLPLALEGGLRAHRLAFARIAAILQPGELLLRLHRLGERLRSSTLRLETSLARHVERSGAGVRAACARLRVDLLIQPLRQRADQLGALGQRLHGGFSNVTGRRVERLRALASLLSSLGYRGVLARGFALVRAADGTPLRTAAAAGGHDDLSIEFADGSVNVHRPAAGPAPPRPKRSGSDALLPGQNDLFGVKQG